MTRGEIESLLARLARHAGKDPAELKPVSTTVPVHEPTSASGASHPPGPAESIEAMVSRIERLARGEEPPVSAPPPAAIAGAPAPAVATPHANGRASFLPREPESLKEAKLGETEVEALIAKYLLSCGSATGREISDQLRLPFAILENLFRQLKHEQLVVYRGSAAMGDYEYQLTDMGRDRARRYYEHCTYFGSAPVSLPDYVASVQAQSLTLLHPTAADLRQAFSDLLINDQMLARLGPAVNSGRGLFLYGAPGNGKTSIAERITRAFGQHVWIPRALGIEGEIIRVYDPTVHEAVPVEQGAGLLDDRRTDNRWIKIQRPTIVVGGELTMDMLEVKQNTSTRINEAPLQLKSNCGTLVIDDFGRQKMSTDQLLNRWIVPLEKRYDFLNLPNGKKIQVPFDQLIIFSTNLQPRDLVDEAFLRRIPYKIDVPDPSEEEFRSLIRLFAPKLGFQLDEQALDYLIERHYKAVNRPFRCCQPRDLLLQIRNACLFRGESPALTPQSFDFAVANYFAVM